MSQLYTQEKQVKAVTAPRVQKGKEVKAVTAPRVQPVYPHSRTEGCFILTL